MLARATAARGLAAAIGLDAESALVEVNEAALPNRRGSSVRYNQLYRGVPIWAQQVVVRRYADGRLRDAGGTAAFAISPTRTAPPSPRLSAANVLQIGTASIQSKARIRSNRIVDPTSELVYRVHGGELQLVYRVSFVSRLNDGSNRPTRPVYFVDAGSGAILDGYENIQPIDQRSLEFAKHLGTGPGGNVKVGRYEWGSGRFRSFLVTQRGDTCHMDGERLQTEDLANGSALDATNTPFSYPCFDNPGIEQSGAYSPMNDAQAIGEVVYDLYRQWYGLAPLGLKKLLLRVRDSWRGDSYANAFWDGTAMTFGNGGEHFYPLVSLDVTGHEVSHGFTELNSGLLYKGQSGGMNESFSDMAGIATQAYFVETYGQPFADFTIPDKLFSIGLDVTRPPREALRYMCDPPRDGHSIDHVKDYEPDMNPHSSSGVYNKVFCVLAKRDGWSIRKAFEVFATANIGYWTPLTNYQSGAEDTLKAAAYLDYPVADVAAALKVVGIDLPLLAVSEASDSFAGPRGGRFKPQRVVLRLTAPVKTSWDVTGVPNWLQLSQTSGVVRDGKVGLEVTLTAAAAKLKRSATATLTFYNDTQPGQRPIKRQIRIVVKGAGRELVADEEPSALQ